jgi:hypothetical protein
LIGQIAPPSRLLCSLDREGSGGAGLIRACAVVLLLLFAAVALQKKKNPG